MLRTPTDVGEGFPKPQSAPEGAPAGAAHGGMLRTPTSVGEGFPKPQSGAEGEAPSALPMEGATRAPLTRAPLTQAPLIALLSAGTADIPVAEEARVTAEALGHTVVPVYDVGVAGLHRLFEHRALLEQADVVIAVAGMDGVLPGIVGGLIGQPVIAVPTSVGYGTGTGGIAALMTMLNACSAGLAVMNIDNGFGAAILAHRILRGMPQTETRAIRQATF